MTDWTSLKVLCNFQSATKVFRVMRWSEFHHVIKKCISSDYFQMQCLRIFSSLNSFLWSWPEYHGCVWVSGDVHRASVTEQLGDLERLRRGRRERAERRGQRREVLVADRKRGQSQHSGNNFHIHIWTTPGDHCGHEETEAWTETIDGNCNSLYIVTL